METNRMARVTAALSARGLATRIAERGPLLRDVDGCAVWQGGTNGNGVPQVFAQGRPANVVRLVRTILNQELPGPGEGLMNTCGNRRCVDPDHYEVVEHGQWSRRPPDDEAPVLTCLGCGGHEGRARKGPSGWRWACAPCVSAYRRAMRRGEPPLWAGVSVYGDDLEPKLTRPSRRDRVSL